MKKIITRQKRTNALIILLYIIFMLCIAFLSSAVQKKYETEIIGAFGERVVSLAKTIATQFSISEERVYELYEMDISTSIVQNDVIEFKEKVAKHLDDEIQYVYFEVELPENKVKYNVLENEASDYGVPSGTALNYFYVYTSEDESEYDDKMRFDVVNNIRDEAYKSKDLTYDYFENDFWGRYITGYAPYYDDDGKFIGLFGVDVNADELHSTIKSQKFLLVFLLILFSIITAYGVYHIIKALDKASFIDNLTGFYNANYIRNLIGKALSRDNDGESICCILFNIDNFKEMNTEYGHIFGDKVLISVSKKISHFKECHIDYIRMKADEFILLFSYSALTERNTYILEELYSLFKSPIYIDDIPINISITSGIVNGMKKNINVDKILEYSDYALAIAKRKHRGSWYIFDKNSFEDFEAKKDRLRAIPTILEHNLLYPVFQPIMNVISGELFGYEALTRCIHTSYSNNIQNLVVDAVSTGHQHKMEKQMLSNIFKTCDSSNIFDKNVTIFVNESARNFFTQEEYKTLFSNIDPNKIVVEFTEYEEIEFAQVVDKINIIRGLGARVALDDFGSGYSNINTLLQINPDIIKLDKGLVRDISKDNKKKNLVKHIISYAKEAGIMILGECIETSDEFNCLIEMGIDLAQGYFIGRPDIKFKDISNDSKNCIH